MKQKTKSIDTSLEDNRDNNPKGFRKILEIVVGLFLISHFVCAYTFLFVMLLKFGLVFISYSGISTNIIGTVFLVLALIAPPFYLLARALLRGYVDIFYMIFNKNNKKE